jgi:uncharacterized protein (DUF1499 family)
MWWLIPLVGLIPIVWFAYLSATSTRPDDLGVVDGRLRECRGKPNCVCTGATDAEHAIPPLTFEGSPDEAWKRLEKTVQGMAGAKVITTRKPYLHAEFTSRIFRFVDDVELLLDEDQQVIHFRSASRVGHSDLGVNRHRMESLRQRFTEK